MFSLSGPCELLFFLWCIASWTLVLGSIMLYPCILCVALLMYCVFDWVCELFGETIRNMFGCGCYLVVECYGSV